MKPHDKDEDDRAFREAAGESPNENPDGLAVEVDTIEAFAEVEEAGATPLVGDAGNALIPEAGDVMVYGDGGAGKTTLMVDGACHFGAGQAWLGIPVTRPLKVLLVEVEGPRPLMRAKLRRKLDAWTGKPIEGRVLVLRAPWAKFTFADEQWRAELARIVDEQQVDIIIAGPLTRIGMEEAGTLQQVRDFMRLVDDLRERSGQRVAVVLIHHENRAGTVSGAWEGAGDTLLHVEERGPGHTHLHIQKARWSSEHHGMRLDLGWTDGDGFAVEDERNYVAEITALLGDDRWRTAKEIATPRDKPEPGIGAGVDTVKATLKGNPDIFIECQGSEVGRHHNATVYGLTLPQKSDESDGGSHRTAGTSDSSPLTPVGGGGESDTVPSPQTELTSTPKSDGSEAGAHV